jgi:hypothetical protein
MNPRQGELLAWHRERALVVAAAPGLPPVADDLACARVPPAGRGAQRPEVHDPVLDLGDLAIDACPALDSATHYIAWLHTIELHRSRSARSRSAPFTAGDVSPGPEGSLERRALRAWREDACRQRFEQNRASARRPSGIGPPHQLHFSGGGEGRLGGWCLSRAREAAWRQRFEQKRASRRRPAGGDQLTDRRLARSNPAIMPGEQAVTL